MSIIDAYTHVLPLEVIVEAKKILSSGALATYLDRQLSRAIRFPHCSDIATRVTMMDKFGIDFQVAMPIPAFDPAMTNAKKSERFRLVRMINDIMAGIPRKSSGRIIPTGVIPLVEDAEEDEAIDEIERAITELGLKGFMVPTNVNGKPIDAYNYLWERCAKMDVPIFIHPASTPVSRDRPYENEYDLMHVFGWPFETTLVLSRLVLSGTMDRIPNLKVVGHHLGGMVPFFLSRISESYSRPRGRGKPVNETHLKHQVHEYFKSFYYDTAVGGSQEAIRCGYSVFGADRLLFATDFPYGPEGGTKRLANYPNVVRSLGLGREEEERIFENNASKLLRI